MVGTPGSLLRLGCKVEMKANLGYPQKARRAWLIWVLASWIGARIAIASGTIALVLEIREPEIPDSPHQDATRGQETRSGRGSGMVIENPDGRDGFRCPQWSNSAVHWSPESSPEA